MTLSIKRIQALATNRKLRLAGFKQVYAVPGLYMYRSVHTGAVVYVRTVG